MDTSRVYHNEYLGGKRVLVGSLSSEMLSVSSCLPLLPFLLGRISLLLASTVPDLSTALYLFLVLLIIPPLLGTEVVLGEIS